MVLQPVRAGEGGGMAENLLQKLLEEIFGSEATYVLLVEIFLIIVSYFIYCYRQGRMCFRNSDRGRRRRKKEEMRKELQKNIDKNIDSFCVAVKDRPDTGVSSVATLSDQSLQTIHIHLGDERKLALFVRRDGTVIKVQNNEVDNEDPNENDDKKSKLDEEIWYNASSRTTTTVAEVHQSPASERSQRTRVVHVTETIV